MFDDSVKEQARIVKINDEKLMEDKRQVYEKSMA